MFSCVFYLGVFIQQYGAQTVANAVQDGRVMTHFSEYERRMNRALAEMQANSIRHIFGETWLDRGLRRVGLRLRPIYYYTPWQVALFGGLYFSLAYGGAMYLLSWRHSDNLLEPLIGLLVSGTVFGAVFGGFVAIQLRRYRLSRWKDL